MENIKPLDAEGLAVLWTQILLQFVKKEEGKGLSTNDLTNELLQKIQSAGTSNFDGYYNSLIGQPQINGITLSGNKTLEDLGVTQAITDAIGDVTQISFEVIPSFADLPIIGEVGTFYLTPNSGSENNNYDEWIWNEKNSMYELIGSIQSEIQLNVDSTLSETSENPVQNKVITKNLGYFTKMKSPAWNADVKNIETGVYYLYGNQTENIKSYPNGVTGHTYLEVYNIDDDWKSYNLYAVDMQKKYIGFKTNNDEDVIWYEVGTNQENVRAIKNTDTFSLYVVNGICYYHFWSYKINSNLIDIPEFETFKPIKTVVSGTVTVYEGITLPGWLNIYDDSNKFNGKRCYIGIPKLDGTSGGAAITKQAELYGSGSFIIAK